MDSMKLGPMNDLKTALAETSKNPSISEQGLMCFTCSTNICKAGKVLPNEIKLVPDCFSQHFMLDTQYFITNQTH